MEDNKMSDLLIKNMKMPYDCGECRFFELYLDSDTRKNMGGIGECHAGEFVQTGYKRDEDCPLVEVKPHGRLIDADALKESLLSDEDYRFFVIEDIDEVIKKHIDTAPTVLEASR